MGPGLFAGLHKGRIPSPQGRRREPSRHLRPPPRGLPMAETRQTAWWRTPSPRSPPAPCNRILRSRRNLGHPDPCETHAEPGRAPVWLGPSGQPMTFSLQGAGMNTPGAAWSPSGKRPAGDPAETAPARAAPSKGSRPGLEEARACPAPSGRPMTESRPAPRKGGGPALGWEDRRPGLETPHKLWPCRPCRNHPPQKRTGSWAPPSPAPTPPCHT